MDEEEWIETQDEFGREILVRAEDFKPVTQNPQQTMEFVQTESAGHLIDVQYVQLSGPKMIIILFS